MSAIAARLDSALQVEFTNYDLRKEARCIADHAASHQAFLLEWTERAAAVNLQLGHLFVTQAPQLLTPANRRAIEAWVLQALDEIDQAGLKTAVETLRHPQRYVARGREHAGTLVTADMAPMLQHVLTGLSGRALRLEVGRVDQPSTDSETLYLPAVVTRFDAWADNRALAKAWVAMLWAQTRFGSFRLDWLQACSRFADAARARACLAALENLRLEARVRRMLPGLGRDLTRLQALAATPPLPSAWQAWAERLAAPGSRAEDSLALVPAAMAEPLPAAAPHACAWTPEAVAATQAARQVREKALMRVELARWLDPLSPKISGPAEHRMIRWRQPGPPDADLPLQHELLLDGQPMPVPPVLQALLSSVQLDFGTVPPEYLEPAGPGEYRPDGHAATERDPDSVWSGTYHEDGALFYPEWDYRRQHMRKNWCVMREIDIQPVDDGFRDQVLRRHAGLTRQLRRAFEALREQPRIERRQADGEELDLDALVQAHADAKAGHDRDERVYARRHRAERDIAALFLVDMSGSTKGWINDVERDALILLAESLQALGDRYAIYGFSGMTRKRCELFRIKRFDEAYGPVVQSRIAGIQPRDYTRMGFAVRHATHLLGQLDARRRLLVVISDGKPDDYSDKYRGTYGIEDTRHALQAAAHAGVHPFCITVDKEAHDYLPRLYGAARYVVVHDLAQLPRQVADVYRRLTR